MNGMRLVGMQGVLAQFTMAAAESETLHYLKLIAVECPFQDIVNLCRANRSVKVLELCDNVFHFDQAASLDFRPSASDYSSMTTLDKLILGHVRIFYNLPAELLFADLVARLKIKALSLDLVHWNRTRGARGEAEGLTRFISSLVVLTVKRLDILGSCPFDVFRPALRAIKTTLEELSLVLTNPLPDHRGKVEFLTKEMPDMASFQAVRITCGDRTRIHPEIKRQFLREVDACNTLTEIQVDDVGNGNFSQDEIQWLRGRAERNRNLRLLKSSPLTFPQRELLVLMLKLQNCPSGRFELARALVPAELYGSQQA